MCRRDGQEFRNKSLCVWPASYREKVDQLDQQSRLSAARRAHDIYQVAQSREKALVTSAQQRPAPNITNTGSLHNKGARSATRETLVPLQYVVAHESVVGCAPRHHGRHPRAVSQC